MGLKTERAFEGCVVDGIRLPVRMSLMHLRAAKRVCIGTGSLEEKFEDVEEAIFGLVRSERD